MDESEKSGITSREDGKRFAFSRDPSTVTVMNSENIGGGVETGSTGERDMHSDATSHKHPVASTAPVDDGPKHEDSSSSASNAALTDHDGHGKELSGMDSTAPSPPTGHGSESQSAEGLASDMPDRKGIHTPASSGDRATDITGIPYIQ